MERIVKWLEYTYENSEEFRTFIKEPTIRNFRKFVEFAFEELYSGDEVCMTNGASRAVIMLADSDWVIKMPVAGNVKNYCEEELNVYERAVELGIEEMFAKCAFLMDFHGEPIYVMERVRCDETEVSDEVYHILSEAQGFDTDEDLYAYVDGSNELYVDLLPAYYSESDYEKFLELRDEFQLNDFHVGNFGYRVGQVVLIDYTCYEG